MSRREEIRLEDPRYRARWIFDRDVLAPGMAIAGSPNRPPVGEAAGALSCLICG
jgi:hypothetical protein